MSLGFATELIRKAAINLFPVAVTMFLFLILYNNLDNGLLIYILLIFTNIVFLIIPKIFHRLPLNSEVWSVCIISVLTALISLELAFPRLFPAEYSKVVEISKPFLKSTEEKAGDVLVFTNPDQKRLQVESPSLPDHSPLKVWHAAGGEFVYSGYDPNEGSKYLNQFRWNSQGYFDHDYEKKKPAGMNRVLVIGDSYVESIQVPLAISFHKRLESFLNESYGAVEKKFEVIALGNSGSGQRDHHSVLIGKAIQYEPDVVIITLCSNDFCDDDPALKRELVLAAGSTTPMFRKLVTHNYMAAAFALRRIEDLHRSRITVQPELLQWSKADIPRVENAWNGTLKAVKASNDFCKEKNIEFFLVYIGSELEVNNALDPIGTLSSVKSLGSGEVKDWDFDKSIRRISDFCAANRIHLILLTPHFVAAQKAVGSKIFGDHFTAFGHKIAAYAIAGKMASCLGYLSPDRVAQYFSVENNNTKFNQAEHGVQISTSGK